MLGSRLMIMPVLSNPFVERFLVKHDIRIIYDVSPQTEVLPE